MGKTVQVSDYVYQQLDDIKGKRDHQTFDSAIRDLLRGGQHE